MTVHQAIRTV